MYQKYHFHGIVLKEVQEYICTLLRISLNKTNPCLTCRKL
ncbi:MAG: hypothetical protein ACI9EA_001818 [Pseudomonadales bacterium]